MVKLHKAFKFRLLPTRYQQELFAKTFGCVRLVYNIMLAERISTYEQYKSDPAVLKTIKKPTPAKYKKDYPFLKEVDSLALANAQMNLEKAYKTFFVGQNKFPRFKSKKHKKSYTTNMVNGNIKIENNSIKLPKVGFVKMKMHRQIPFGHKIKSCTISQNAAGKYFVSILTEFDHEIVPTDKHTGQAVGLDFAMNGLYVDSEGEKANYPRFYRQSLEKLKKAQRYLSRKKKGSSNYEKQRIRLAKLHEKIANQRKDFLHKQANGLLEQYDIIAIEDLHMQGMSRALHFGKSVMDNAWGVFTAILAYKTRFQGKYLVKIDKWFPSSKTCSCCGQKKDSLSLAERVFTCESCGFTEDRDTNAALNIKAEGLKTLLL